MRYQLRYQYGSLFCLLLVLVLWPSSARAWGWRLTYTPRLVVVGLTERGAVDVIEPVTRVPLPAQSYVQILVAQRDDGRSWGRMVWTSPDWTSLTSTVAQVDRWSNLSPSLCIVKYRVTYKSALDWLVCTLRAERDATGKLIRWKLDSKITDYYGRYTYVTRPTVYLPADSVRLTLAPVGAEGQ